MELQGGGHWQHICYPWVQTGIHPWGIEVNSRKLCHSPSESTKLQEKSKMVFWVWSGFVTAWKEQTLFSWPCESGPENSQSLRILVVSKRCQAAWKSCREDHPSWGVWGGESRSWAWHRVPALGSFLPRHSTRGGDRLLDAGPDL